MLKTTDDSKRVLKTAMVQLGIERGKEHGMYAPLARRCPLYIDEAIPPMARMVLEQQQTCACTNSDVVYVDTNRALDFFTKARAAVAKQYSNTTSDALEITDYRAQDNYITVLAHEYTHILMKHVEKGIKFCNANGDKNYPIFAFACDIEANRGYLVDSTSDVYQIAVTEEVFPKCKGVVGLMNIYRTLKKYYGDEILRDYDEKVGGKGKGVDRGEGVTKTSGSPSSSSPSTRPDSPQHRKEVVQRNAHSVEELRSEMEKLKAVLPPEQLNKNVELYDESKPVPSSATSVGADGEEEGLYDGTPHQILGAYYNRAHQAQLDKMISRLKGVVRGETIKARVKTYSRQSRKTSDDNLIRKGTKQGKSIAPKILVAMDSSGSMSSTSVVPVAEAIGTLAKMIGKTKGSWICEHDAYVKNVRPLSQWEDVVKGYCPRGDNDFNEVLKKALELGVDAVINIGDGYAHITNIDYLQQAKQKGLKWFDVQVSGTREQLEGIYETERVWLANHGEPDVRLERELLSCE